MELLNVVFKYNKEPWIVEELIIKNRCIAKNLINGKREQFNRDYVRYKTIED